MRTLPAIAGASFHELVRQPASLLLTLGGVALMIVQAHTSYFALGEEARQAKQGMLALMLMTGLLAAVMGASSSITREIRSGTALALLAKPVGRLPFILGKFLGLAAALLLQGGVQLMGLLLAGRMAESASRQPDWIAIAILLGALLAPLLLGAAASFFAHASFVGTANLSMPVCVLAAFVTINALEPAGGLQPWGSGLDRALVPAGWLILVALLALAALALALSTRLAMLSTLLLCGALLILGLLSDHLLGVSLAPESPLRRLLQAIVPNWQVFWVADALGESRGLPWSYVLRATAYGLLHLSMALSLAWFLFANRELN